MRLLSILQLPSVQISDITLYQRFVRWETGSRPLPDEIKDLVLICPFRFHDWNVVVWTDVVGFAITERHSASH